MNTAYSALVTEAGRLHLSGDLDRLAKWWTDHGAGFDSPPAWFLQPHDDMAGAVDRAVDSGATAILLAVEDADLPARAVIASESGCSAASVVRYESDMNDFEWMQTVALIRDLRRDLSLDPRVSNLAAALTRSSARRTPVIFDGVLAHAAALVAAGSDLDAPGWWLPASSSSDPAIAAAQRQLDTKPALDLNLDGRGEGGLRACWALVELVVPEQA